MLRGIRQQLGCCEGLGGSGAFLELWYYTKGDCFDLGNISGMPCRQKHAGSSQAGHGHPCQAARTSDMGKQYRKMMQLAVTS